MIQSSRVTAVARLLIAQLAIAAFATGAMAQASGYRLRLDSLFTILETHQRMMGSVTIRQAGRVVYSRTIGYRDSSASGWIPSDSATMFRVGSVTKPFTAAMIYRHIDAHRLTLDTRLAKFFPQLPAADSITIRDLLAHTSGLGDYTRGMDPMVALDRATILRRIAESPTQFRPGTSRRYNNSNFLLLGYIVEAVAKSTYIDVLNRQILSRVRLTRTDVGGPIAANTNEAHAYYFSGGHWERQPEDLIANAGGAGSITSTTSDLTQFLAALFERRLITRASLEEMTHGFDSGAFKSGKGLSPFDIPRTDRTGYSHDGSIGAHTALIGYVPKDSLALALTINGHNFPINRIFFQVWGILYGTNAALPNFTPVAFEDSIAVQAVGTYSAPDYGLTMTVRRAGAGAGVGAGLEAQTLGQEAFPLTYLGGRRFQFVSAGILMEFFAAVGGASPGFTLFQQKAAIPLKRVAAMP
jgi:D-alanyl-D-alanine carboxypeptidase